MLRIFTFEKSNGFGLNQQTWVPEASMLTTRPPKPSILYVYIKIYFFGVVYVTD